MIFFNIVEGRAVYLIMFYSLIYKFVLQFEKKHDRIMMKVFFHKQTKKRHIIGYFESKDSENYRTFVRVASVLRDDCQLHAAFGYVVTGVICPDSLVRSL